MVVEDDPLVRLVATEALRDAGLTVSEAATADEALAILLAAAGDYDAVFSDIEMPGKLDGLELARVVNDCWPAITVVLTSGRVRPSPTTLASSVCFLSKPYHLEHVVALLTKSPRAG